MFGPANVEQIAAAISPTNLGYFRQGQRSNCLPVKRYSTPLPSGHINWEKVSDAKAVGRANEARKDGPGNLSVASRDSFGTRCEVAAAALS
jgi:hypothetical protein